MAKGAPSNKTNRYHHVNPLVAGNRQSAEHEHGEVSIEGVQLKRLVDDGAQEARLDHRDDHPRPEDPGMILIIECGQKPLCAMLDWSLAIINFPTPSQQNPAG